LQEEIMDLTLPATPPFNLDAVVRSHGWVQLPPLSYDRERQTLTTVLRLGDGQGPDSIAEVCIRPTTGQDAPPGVVVTTTMPETVQTRTALTRDVTWMLQLRHDLSDFYELTRDEPHLAHVEAEAKGRILRSPTLFEDVVKTILTTNTSWQGTLRMTNALVTHLGTPLPAKPARRAFPTPGQIAAVDEAFLRDTTKLGYRAPRILALARDVVAHRIDLEALKADDRPTSEVREALLAIKGVGPYAAASLLALLGRFDDVPVDSWARTLVSKHRYDGEPVTPAQVRDAFADWGPWKALAYWFWDWNA
jgi:3-methyladenine DNA glycosylase/8-oxoguanine DNA glycosylase